MDNLNSQQLQQKKFLIIFLSPALISMQQQNSTAAAVSLSNNFNDDSDNFNENNEIDLEAVNNNSNNGNADEGLKAVAEKTKREAKNFANVERSVLASGMVAELW